MADAFIYPVCRLVSGNAARLAAALQRFYEQPVDVQRLTDAREPRPPHPKRM